MIDVITRVAHERGTTYILMGAPPPRNALAAPDAALAAVPDPARAARRRPAHRRRPHAAPEEVTHDRARRDPRGRARRARRRPSRCASAARRSPQLHDGLPHARSCSPSPAPRSPSAASTRRCGSRASTARRSCRCSSREVPMHLPLDAALPQHVRQRAAAARGGRAARGARRRRRSTRGSSAAAPTRHAIRQLVEHEPVDTIVVTAGDAGRPGLLPDDIGWLLEHVPGEIIVIRPGTADLLLLTPPGRSRPARSWRAAGRRPGRAMPRRGTPDANGHRAWLRSGALRGSPGEAVADPGVGADEARALRRRACSLRRRFAMCVRSSDVASAYSGPHTSVSSLRCVISRPRLVASARSSENSIGVRCTSSPSSVTVCAARSTTRPSASIRGSVAARPARRSTACTRATSSPGANGFVT